MTKACALAVAAFVFAVTLATTARGQSIDEPEIVLVRNGPVTVPTKNPKTRRGRIRHMSIGSVTRGSQSAVAGMVGSARTTVSGG
jgi:hypothetical protein